MAAKNKNRSYIKVQSVPNILKESLQVRADKAGISLSSLCKKLLSSSLETELQINLRK